MRKDIICNIAWAYAYMSISLDILKNIYYILLLLALFFIDTTVLSIFAQGKNNNIQN